MLLADQAYEKLRELLTVEGLRAGQFVSMPDLVELLGFPLAPTREAVKRAEAGSLVTVLPKRGVLVMEATSTAIRECFDLRTIFDQEGARRLVRQGRPESLSSLRLAHEKILERARADVTTALQQQAKELDWALHLSLGGALENAAAQEIYALNRDKIAIIQQTRPFLPERIASAMEEHIRIIDAILARDEEQAARAVREHYRNTLRWWGILL